jgi:hypothetical protein
MAKIKPDPKWPMPSEVIFYKTGDQALAIDLYSKRMQVSAATAEDTIRAYLVDLGFEVGALFIPRED